MNQQDNRNDDINLESDTLTDLHVTNEQADETKGGSTDGADYLVWQRNLGTR